ncbi:MULTISPECIES: imidazolonepropionase [unclassified Virgibacillus]|uniref:imidazolonepropionase n=1 Tax=unclassified Virgibacillus TaxID=2620237 RepID=UPI00090B9E5F|nr:MULTISPECIES: imidazolonepropionase [unclassified Virgibacillus]API91190.1 imidazolonepropionase [Virgibacillus sp. 6R]MBS7429183.1 imidazolonepropionase [Virgibacillus sp. 19R1-5]
MSNTVFVKNAAQLITMQGHSEKSAKREAMQNIGLIENGSVLAKDGKIIAVGSEAEIRNAYPEIVVIAKEVNAKGKTVTPGLIDPHTHLVHAGTRENEYAMRLKGKTYMDIMNAGGGIHATTEATQKASFEQLYQESKKRLDTFLLNGVTTVEAKSGYGLTTEHEIKQLEVAEKLNQDHVVDIVSTFMGAHAVPISEKDQPEEFVDKVINEMLPAVAERHLAKFNDVFCERGVFTPEQSRRILEAGKQYGLIPKIHADEIEPYGGAELAAEVGAISADHLLKASEAGIQQMAEKDVVGVLLPGTAFFLMAEFAQARKMIDSGVAVALSTDANPGSSPTLSLQFIMNLGCLKMGMTPEEVITATTMNAAHAIGSAHEVGSLEVGKKADLTIFDVPNYLTLSYQYGMNHVDTVIKNGQIVVEHRHLVTS